jgi:hypothetical protein
VEAKEYLNNTRAFTETEEAGDVTVGHHCMLAPLGIDAFLSRVAPDGIAMQR